MAHNQRIPRGIEEFHDYMETTALYMKAGSPVTNGARLGLQADEIETWSTLHTSCDELYPRYIDKKNSRTTVVKDDLHNIVDETLAFNRKSHILDRIAASPNVTIADLSTFNIKAGPTAKSGRSTPQSSITELVTTNITQIGGGVMSIKCYGNSSQRAGIIEGADCVQYLYTVGNVAPVSAEDDVLKLGISVKGNFKIATGPGSSGKNLYIYFRWCNNSHPDLAGPWSALQTMLIL